MQLSLAIRSLSFFIGQPFNELVVVTIDSQWLQNGGANSFFWEAGARFQNRKKKFQQIRLFWPKSKRTKFILIGQEIDF